MSGALKVLGENLKNQTPTQGSVEPLKLLMGYYEHQQNQLKGFEKNPQKLQENLAIMDGWINAIRALIDTLA
jgi:hypothetical protein